VIDEITQGVFEAAGEYLTREGDGDELELVVIVGFVTRHLSLPFTDKRSCSFIVSPRMQFAG